MATLNAAAAACTEEMWVIMSDVFLDQPDVLEKLSRVLGAFEGSDAPPTLFVLIGEFCSVPFGPASPNLSATRGACRCFTRAALRTADAPHRRCV